jgi:hypothetical protein
VPFTVPGKADVVLHDTKADGSTKPAKPASDKELHSLRDIFFDIFL